jgi:predicted  nucleic acid-binding Zn-ribbon protein
MPTVARPRLAVYNPLVTRASQLHDLQLVDTVLDGDRHRLTEIQRSLEDDRALASARATLEQAERLSREAAEAVRAAEDTVAIQQEKLREIESRLYGGQLHNPKELQDLQRDAESLQRHLATLNDRLLEAMLAQEQSDHARQSALEAVQRRESERMTANGKLSQEMEQLQADVARRTTEREVLLGRVETDDLALYDRLRQSSGGFAVAVVEDGACGACGLVLSASGRQEVHTSPSPVRCRQCGRILYSG